MKPEPVLPPLRVLVVDDEELARVRLRQLLGDCTEPQAQLVAEAANAAQALSWLQSQDCDVVLLDIAMPGLNGLRMAELLHERLSPPAVVFVTAHAGHALQAFDLNAIDYLTKPVRRERLQAALKRVAARGLPLGAQALPSTQAAAQVSSVPPMTEGEGALRPSAPWRAFHVQHRGRLVRVPLEEVFYFKAELKYVTLRTVDESYVLDESLAEIEQRLGAQGLDRFIRIHRNALVAKHVVKALERRAASHVEAAELDEAGGSQWAVRVAVLDEWLAVSRRQLKSVREAIKAG